jgi:DMSO reductase anchor subunit
MSQKSFLSHIKDYIHIELVPEWKQFWKMASFWVYVVIGAMPDIYAGLTAAGLLDEGALPTFVVYSIRVLAAIGIIARLIKQKSLEAPTSV